MSRMPSTSTGTVSVTPAATRGVLDLAAQRVPDGREDQRQRRERFERHRAAAELGGVGGHEPDERLVEEVLDDEARGASPAR